MDEFNKLLKWAFTDIQGSNALSLDKNRLYDGQIHTYNGKRGKQIISGLTAKDISDCIVLGILDAGGIKRNYPIHDDIYTLNFSDLDPGAIIQNSICHIEKMMKIYPNIPKPKTKENKGEINNE